MMLSQNRWSAVAFAGAFAALLPGAATADDIVIKRFSGGDYAK
jgi:hypothetical protein